MPELGDVAGQAFGDVAAADQYAGFEVVSGGPLGEVRAGDQGDVAVHDDDLRVQGHAETRSLVCWPAEPSCAKVGEC